MNKTIIKLDASALKSGACDEYMHLNVLEGYREPMMYNDTQYGVAFHAFASRMAESDNDFAEAHKAAMAIMKLPCVPRDKKQHLTEKHLINTCVTYFNDVESKRSNFEYIINPQAKCWRCNGTGNVFGGEGSAIDEANYVICSICEGEGTRPQPLAEVTFQIKIYEDEDFIVYVCGTIDRIGKIKNGAYCIRDYKTSSSWDAKKHLASFKTSVQFILYLWALKRMAKDNPNSILTEITKFPMVAFIDGVFLKSKQETEFHTSDAMQYKEWQFDEFEVLLAKQIRRILDIAIAAKKNGVEKNGKMLGLCYGFFPCKYINVCHALDDVVAKHVLQKNFKQKPYNPLNFRD